MCLAGGAYLGRAAYPATSPESAVRATLAR